MKVNIYKSSHDSLVNPNSSPFEVVERKFRGHPDSLADMVAQTFSKKYIEFAWKNIPKLNKKYFPNFSADKVTLSGSSSNHVDGSYQIIKPVDALLIGKITQSIGNFSINCDLLFKESIEEVFSKALGHDNYKTHVKRQIYSVNLAGSDHSSSFYNPKSVDELVKVLEEEKFANDTVYVVAYHPISVTEELSIHIDNFTYSSVFQNQFPEIGSDIKVMIRRRGTDFQITLCLPVFPEKVSKIKRYEEIINSAHVVLYDEVKAFLKSRLDTWNTDILIDLKVNTKDTASKKYFALWGTSLSKGDVGAVGRGNRQQGFISGLRSSSNEAVSGKNPNYFAGIVCQLVAEDISKTIYRKVGLKNVVYVTTDNGDKLNEPASIDIIVDCKDELKEMKINKIIKNSLSKIDLLCKEYIKEKPFTRFMRNCNE